eukprot:15281174-Alexandrium_andersonii.AAC.1
MAGAGARPLANGRPACQAACLGPLVLCSGAGGAGVPVRAVAVGVREARGGCGWAVVPRRRGAWRRADFGP